MTPELVLKRYERGMTAEQIAATDNLTVSSVQAIINASNVTPIKRNNTERKTVLITDDEIIRRLADGETRHAIEKDFDLTPGTLSSRVKRIKRDQAANKAPVKQGRKPRVTDEMLAEMVKEGKTSKNSVSRSRRRMTPLTSDSLHSDSRMPSRACKKSLPLRK